MNTSSPNPTPADDLLEQVRQAVTDLAEVCQRLPVDPAEAERVAKIMDRLGEECAEAAAMLRALPNRPAERPGYSFAALAAIITAAEAEHDLSGWLADLLCRAAAYLGSADHLVMGRSGSWEAQHVTALVRQTAGPLPGDLDRYKDGAPQ
ncbi:MAG TPA: hypothetical protein VII22_15710 [Streptosporangiaceae bacterium]